MGLRVSVDEIPSERWDLAVNLIRSGEATVFVEGEIAVGFWRETGSPGADGKVHVSVVTRVGPSQLTEAAMDADGRLGILLLSHLLERDTRLRELLGDRPIAMDYVFDYGNGSVALGEVGPDGHVTPT